MAKSLIHLSFSHISNQAADRHSCELLFTQAGHVPKKGHFVSAHTHPFWQMEIVTRGRIHASVAHHHCELSTGDCLLIPPDMSHSFSYPHIGSEWISLKFTARSTSKNVPFLQPILDPLGQLMRDTLIHLVTRGQAESATRIAMEGALAGFLLLCFPPYDKSQRRMADAVCDYVQTHPTAAHTVKSLSLHLGYSTGHLSAAFQRDLGRPLKVYLDQQRLHAAQRLLQYADMTIAQIATAMHFPDIFSFSRFFKRVSGITPSEFRNRKRSV